MKRGKKYKTAFEKIEKNKSYSKEEAVKLIKDFDVVKFDPSIELAINLNIDSKKADQQVRGALNLPHGTGKVKRVLVLAKGEALKAAEKAGADYFGEEEMIEKIEKENFFDYDVIVATPEMMPKLGKIGKILGPKD